MREYSTFREYRIVQSPHPLGGRRFHSEMRFDSQGWLFLTGEMYADLEGVRAEIDEYETKCRESEQVTYYKYSPLAPVLV